MRPLGTARPPILDTFGRHIMVRYPEITLRQLMAVSECTIEEVRDKILLCLWDALFISASEQWTKDGVANTTAAEALELGNCFGKGQQFSKWPLLDGIYTMCGCLLTVKTLMGFRTMSAMAHHSIEMYIFRMLRSTKIYNRHFFSGIAHSSLPRNAQRCSNMIRNPTVSD